MRASNRPGAASDAPVAAVGSRFAGLEAYRGIASLAIVVFHVYQNSRYPYPGTAVDRILLSFDGFVDMFFVLSAFLLALPYLRAALAGEKPLSGRAFLFRRAARIIPLYFVAIVTVWAFRNPVVPGDWLDLVEHLTFTQVFDEKRIFYTIGPAWSLAVEVQFYLFLALLGHLASLACRAVAPSRRIPLLGGGILVVAAVSLLWKAVAWYVLERPSSDYPLWFGLIARLDVFAIGMGLALVVAVGVRVERASVLFLMRLASAAVIVFAVVTRPETTGRDVWFHVVVAVGFGLLLASSVLGPQDALVRALSGRGLTFLGLISYSLYLWHEPLLLLLSGLGAVPEASSSFAFPIGVLVLVPTSLAVAWLSYWAIEYPAGSLRLLISRDGSPRQYYNGE